MTITETYQMIMMLLDESRADYCTDNEINRAINEAQLKKLNEYYQKQEERALMPLYRQSEFLDNNDEIIDIGGRHLLYPRSLRIYKNIIQSDSQSQIAEFIDADIYLNCIRTIHRENGGQNFPRSGYYTIIKGIVKSDAHALVQTMVNTQIRFTKGNSENRAKIWYIANPLDYYWDVEDPTNPLNHGLEIADEYHIEVCATAAEIINDMDVGELERGEIAFQNQRLSIEKTA